MPDAPKPQQAMQEPDIPERKVNEVAGYGPVPESYLAAPAYALKVLSRQNEIKEKIKEINERLKRVEAERDGAEAGLGQAAIDFGLVPDIAAEIESKVEEAEKSISSAKGLSRQETAQHMEELKRIDEEIAALKEAIEQTAGLESDGDDKISSVEVEHRRITGTVQRLQIELRNLEGNEEQDRSKIAQVRHKIQELKAEGASVDSTLDQVASQRMQLSTLEAERKHCVDENQEKQGKFSEKTKLASAWRRSKLAVAGRKVLTMDKRPKLLDGDRLFARIEQSQEKTKKVQIELDLHLKALDSYDTEAFGKARIVAMAAGGVLSVLLLSVLLYAC